MRDTTVISGFSGIGKSTAAEEFNRCLDLESSNFSKAANEWPYNYVDAIEEAIESGDYDIILTSCHKEVRKEMHERNIPFIIIGPDWAQREVYVRRWFTRGSDIKFIEHMNACWDSMLNSCRSDDSVYMTLLPGEYLSDLLRRTKGITSSF